MPLRRRVNLEDRLRDVHTDWGNRVPAWLLRIVGALNGAHFFGTRAGGGDVHSINNGHQRTPLVTQPSSRQGLLLCSKIGDAIKLNTR